MNKLYNVKGHYFSSNAEDSQHAGGIIDVPLAQTGEGIAECELLKWFVQDSACSWWHYKGKTPVVVLIISIYLLK